MRCARYDLGEIDGVGLAVTDAVTLADGRVLVSAAAEDSPTTYDDGPVVASALALLDDEQSSPSVGAARRDGQVAQGRGPRDRRPRPAVSLDLVAVWTPTTR